LRRALDDLGVPRLRPKRSYTMRSGWTGPVDYFTMGKPGEKMRNGPDTWDEFEKTLATCDGRKIRFHYNRDIRRFDYSDEGARSVAAKVQSACEKALGGEWNHYSNALRPEVCSGFAKVIRSVAGQSTSIAYLEVGSNQGVSMAFFSEFIRSINLVPVLVSVDPYHSDGYVEGNGAPLRPADWRVPINKSTKQAALALYERNQSPCTACRENELRGDDRHGTGV